MYNNTFKCREIYESFETKLVVKRMFPVRLSSYPFSLNTYGCVQSVALWAEEKVRFSDKRWDAVCREHNNL